MEAVANTTRGQAFLYGNSVYLRPPEKADATSSTAVRGSLYPSSPERTESWITDDIENGKPRDFIVLAIIRTSDDQVVGSLRVDMIGYIRVEIVASVPAVYGRRGQEWKAEALDLVGDWISGERQVPTLIVRLPVVETIVIDRLRASGFVETSRLREKKIVEGQRVDEVTLQRFNQDWLTTLGDPMAIELPRSGTGIARPAPSRPLAIAAPAKNATLIGERVYLRPYTSADLETAVLWTRRETETFHMTGRRLPALTEFVQDVNSDEEEDLPVYVFFTVCERATDTTIGEVGLIHVDYVHRNAETASWFFRPEYREQGFGSEAKHLLLEYAFDVLDLHMVESNVRFENTRSAAALRKQGYRDAGRIGWNSQRDGCFSNFATFDLLATEWRALQSS